MDQDVRETYGNKLRLRVCGICFRNGELLLVNHLGVSEGDFWAPPGGGVEFGESLEEALRREFREETGLDVTVGPFLFGCELVKPPLHAVELFFEVSERGGELRIGFDPEIQIVKDVRFFSAAGMGLLETSRRHAILTRASSPEGFAELRGFYRI